MVVGADEGIGNLTKAIQKGNGRDTIMVVASDNGGSPWFGGMNYPLRSGKLTVYEGGCRVPALAVDFSTDKRFFGAPGRTYGGLMHFSDWLPTFLGFAGVSGDKLESMGQELGWDGMDMGPSIRRGAESWKEGPRKSVLYELALPGETLFGEMIQIGYRHENFKCVAGVSQDPFWYFEPKADMINSTDKGLATVIGEIALRVLDAIFGNGPMDPLRSAITHAVINHVYMTPQFTKMAEDKHRYHESHKAEKGVKLFSTEKVSKVSPLLAPYGGEEGCGVNLAAVLSGMQLYDLDTDPEERLDVSKDHPEIIEIITKELQQVCFNRPQQQRYWIGLDLELSTLLPTLTTGDCSMNPLIKPGHCRFQHPFLPDNFDAEGMNLTNCKDSLIRIITREAVMYLFIGVVSLVVAYKIANFLFSKFR